MPGPTIAAPWSGCRSGVLGADRRGTRLAGGEFQRARPTHRRRAARRPHRPAAGAGETELGPVAGARTVPSLSSGLRAVSLALLVGLRQRRAGRFLLPLLRPGVLGPRAAASDDGRGRRTGPCGEHAPLDDRPAAVSGPRRPAAGDAPLVPRRRRIRRGSRRRACPCGPAPCCSSARRGC